MANTLETIRKISRPVRTEQGKGWETTIKIVAYDHSGMVNVNGMPTGHPSGDRWLAAARVVLELMEDLQRHAAATEAEHV
jgi:hypothetical protein